MLYQDDLITEWGSTNPRQHLEDDLQAKIILLLKWSLPADAKAWHVPNGGKRGKIEAARMTRLGVVPGLPDIHLLYRGRLYCLELKSPKGQLSAIQTQTIAKLATCGAPTAVVREVGDVERALGEWGIPLNIQPGMKGTRI